MAVGKTRRPAPQRAARLRRLAGTQLQIFRGPCYNVPPNAARIRRFNDTSQCRSLSPVFLSASRLYIGLGTLSSYFWFLRQPGFPRLIG